MPTDAAPRNALRPLAVAALARVSRRLYAAPAAPWLHTEVARRMAERLPVIRLQPERIVEWGARIGASRELLQQSYPKAQWLGVEVGSGQPSVQAAEHPPAWWRRWRAPAAAQTVVDEATLSAGQCQLLWANMVLHGAIDPQAVMQRWHRLLATEGFLMFSTLGPGSLQSLRNLYSSQGWPVPHAPFVDMHDLGDMLIEAGFAEPVMDQETITLTWPSAEALLHELRQLGGNVDPRRFQGLRTPRWRQRLSTLLEQGADASGRMGLEFEVVYGHAFRPLPRPRLANETSFALDDMRAMVRAGRDRL